MRSKSAQTFLLGLMILGSVDLNAAPIVSTLFGGLGGHNNGDSTNDGALAIISQTTGAVGIVGHPAGVARISGLAFDLDGALYASTQPSGGFPPPPGAMGGSLLLQLNPANGAILRSVPITDGQNNPSIADLAVQPVTGVLYGIRGPNDQLNGQGKLYTIDKSTGLATLVGDTGHFFGAIAFAPNGTLYMTAADLNFATGDVVNPSLLTLNPSNAATLTTKPISQPIGALGVRPEDGVLFGGTGDQHQLFTIDPATGALTLIGDTGSTFIGDLAFQTPLSVGPGQCVAFPVDLAAPAGPNGVLVTLSSSAPATAFVDLGASPNLLIPAGATTDRRTAQVCGVAFGTATINVSAGGVLLFSRPVMVTASLNFYPASITTPIGLQARPTLLLSAPAPIALTITLKSDNPGVASVPASVTIPAGSNSISIPVMPLASGTTVIHATAPNLPETTLAVTVP
jgi:hypothetical protein